VTGLSGLQGKVAVVTGGGSGIGEATGRRLAEEGASVVVVDRDGEAAERTASLLETPGLAVEADVSEEGDIERYMAEAVERFGRVDLHHLNAGIAGTLAALPDVTAAAFDDVVGVNLRGAFFGLRAAFRQFAAQEQGGAIVLTASIAGLRGSADLLPYHVSKHGVIGLARCGAVYGGPLGVRVNAIAPGIIPTGLLAQAAAERGGSSDALERARAAPLERAGTAEEVAALVAFLLSDESAFLTGEVVSVDGGAAAVNVLRLSRGSS
jgi:NAD(P)-dependent dehydrogenase (short-subunit alcohol dehydrogenase family)